MNAILAYLVGALILAPFGAFVGSLIGFLPLLKSSLIWPWISGVAASFAAYFLCEAFFSWLKVPFHWYSYLICMVPVVLNDGRRTQREVGETFGPEKATAFGCLVGMAGAIAM